MKMKEYKYVKDFEAIFTKEQKIKLVVYSENCHFETFCGKVGIFYQLINKKGKYEEFWGNLEVIDMSVSAQDEEVIIIMAKEHEKTLGEKLEEIKPIYIEKQALKASMRQDIFNEVRTKIMEFIEKEIKEK